MKIISLFMLFGALILSICVSAQMKVYDDNRVKIFGDKPADDYNKDLSMQVYGSYGDYLANGRIGFGDYGIKYNGWPKVFAGELGQDIDSDKLELCGSRGLYLTWGQGYGYDHIIGKMDWVSILLTQRFYFNVDVYAHGTKLYSDIRFKENIHPLENSLNKLKKVRGVNYNLKADDSMTSINAPEPDSEKEKNDVALMNEVHKKLKEDKKERIGFIAQEVKATFPELVDQDSSGYMYVDYIGFIPVLVESIKDQQKQLAQLKYFYKKN